MIRLTIILVVTLMTACVPVWQQKPQLNTESAAELRLQHLAQLEQWQFHGRTVITQEKEAWNAGLKWVQDVEQYHIKLSGPFAQGGVELQGRPSNVVLTLDDGSKLTATTPEALIFDNLGVHMPVSALRDWLRGIPYSKLAVDAIQYDDLGRISQLMQNGWQVEYLRYIPFEDFSMPGKIYIKHTNFSLKLIVSDWEPL